MSLNRRRLAQDVRDEVDGLDEVVREADDDWQQAQTPSAAQRAFIKAAALDLHGFYSHFESLLAAIVREMDEKLPHGDGWHVALLRQASMSVDGIRPAIIRPESARELDALRAFRHRVRNLYPQELDPERMQDSTKSMVAIWPDLRMELLAFAAFLEEDAPSPTENS